MQHQLSARLPERSATDQVIEDSSDMPPIVGRVVARGLADELEDRHYLIVDGVDGRSHYFGIGKGEAVEPLPEGTIVRVTGTPRGVREVDRTIVAVAAANDGHYTIDAHLRFDPNASEAYAETHALPRRLPATFEDFLLIRLDSLATVISARGLSVSSCQFLNADGSRGCYETGSSGQLRAHQRSLRQSCTRSES
jgi:hypothetical protein